VAGTITWKSATCLVNNLELLLPMCSMAHPPPREREECLGCGLHVSGVGWLCQVWTGCVRCGLFGSGVDWLCQVWIECARCGLDVAWAVVSGVDWKGQVEWMQQVWTGCVRCGLHVSGVNWICKYTDKTLAVKTESSCKRVIGQEESHFIPSKCTTHPPEREHRSK